MKKWAWIVIILLAIILAYFIFSRKHTPVLTDAQKRAKITQLGAEKQILSKEIADLQAKIDNSFPGDPNDVIDLQIKKNRVDAINIELASLQK